MNILEILVPEEYPCILYDSPPLSLTLLQIQAAASLLLESKMFYVPFVLNSASIR